MHSGLIRFPGRVPELRTRVGWKAAALPSPWDLRPPPATSLCDVTNFF
jgi:hypothetical protein